MIISDEFWVFIIVVLKEFNIENFIEFLFCVWKIVQGNELKECKDKIIVYFCIGYFMVKVK